MTIAAIIPVKRLGEAKGRIAGRLTPAERRGLVVDMFERVLGALGAVVEISAVFVVTSDEQIARTAGRASVEVIDDPAGGLNAAIDAGREAARAIGVDYALLLHADLPFLRAGEIRGMVALAARNVAVLAPDRAGRGTNALLLPAAAPFEVAFGPDSYENHRLQAAAAGLEVRTYRSRGTAFDLDTADDFDEFQRWSAGAGESAASPGRFHCKS